MLADMQDLREKGGNLEYRDEYGATPVRVFSWLLSVKRRNGGVGEW